MRTKDVKVVYSEAEPSKEVVWCHTVNGEKVYQVFGNKGWTTVAVQDLEKKLEEISEEIDERIAPIEEVIPEETYTEGNELADKNYVNDKVSTDSATFQGSFNVVQDLSLPVDATHEQISTALGNSITTANNNDYAWINVPQSAESEVIERVERYKFDGTNWGFEYCMNDTSIQPDWDQNDNTKADFIKNKPHIKGNALGGIAEGNIENKPGGRYSHTEGHQCIDQSWNYNATTQSYYVNGDFSLFKGATVYYNDISAVIADAVAQDGRTNYFFSSNPFPQTNIHVKIITGALTVNAHAEGVATMATGGSSHAEGSYTLASGYYAHSEGNWTIAKGEDSHAEGQGSKALGYAAHAEGSYSVAEGNYSHAEGKGTKANRRSLHVFGEYNATEDGPATTKGSYIETVGNGTGNSSRSNARTLDWQGNQWLAGNDTALDFILKNNPNVSLSGIANIVNNLPAAALSGSYNDLLDTPDLSVYVLAANLAAVATSGNYEDLSNKPTIPAAQIQSDWNQNDNTKADFIKNRICYEAINSFCDLLYTESKPYTFTFDAPGELIHGQTYKIEITQNGTDYEDTLPAFNDPGYGVSIATDLGTITYSSSSSFDEHNSKWMGRPGITKLKVYQTEIETIDDKFIPDTVARISDVPSITVTQTPPAQGDNPAKTRTSISLNGNVTNIDVPSVTNQVDKHNYNAVKSSAVANELEKRLSVEAFATFEKNVVYKDATVYSDNGVAITGDPIHSAVNVYLAAPTGSEGAYQCKINQDPVGEHPDTYFAVFDVTNYAGTNVYLTQANASKLRVFQMSEDSASDFKEFIDGITTAITSSTTKKTYNNCPWAYKVESNPPTNLTIPIQSGVTTLVVYFGNNDATYDLTTSAKVDAYLNSIDPVSTNAVQSQAIYSAISASNQDIEDILNYNPNSNL